MVAKRGIASVTETADERKGEGVLVAVLAGLILVNLVGVLLVQSNIL
jgi:hypothetical protein